MPRCAALIGIVACAPTAARASDFGSALISGGAPLSNDISGLVILLLLFFSVLTASLHLVGRRRWTHREGELAGA
ncbi:MAG: hypothetical protein JO107_06610, partial [Hyphomicrobiales bacterium]|nr:hypothetical protein [Hyphomicrobiales bacterium]